MNANMARVVANTKKPPGAFSMLYACLKGVHIMYLFLRV